MEKIWFDPENPVGYTGVSKVAKATRSSIKKTQEWLNNQLAYSLNKPMRRLFPTRKYIARGVDGLLQIDLMEIIPYTKINKGYKYIVTCVVVISRYARAVPVKSKSAKHFSEALHVMLEEKQSKSIQTDLGKEFYNSSVKSLFTKYNSTGLYLYSSIIIKVIVLEPIIISI